MREPKKQTTLKEDAGKLLLDLGKLVFGGLFLGGILRGEVPQMILLTGGFMAAMVFCTTGLLWISKERKAGENRDVPAKGE